MSSRGMSKTKAVKDRLRKAAEARQAAYDALTVEQKLAKLPPAPASARQRAKLESQLGNQTISKPATESKKPRAKKNVDT